MIVSTCASLITFIVSLTWCKPVEASWGARPGTCGAVSTMVDIGYFMSAAIIFTDWACAILPVVMLWGLQMRWRVKLSVIIVLALGVL